MFLARIGTDVRGYVQILTRLREGGQPLREARPALPTKKPGALDGGRRPGFKSGDAVWAQDCPLPPKPFVGRSAS
jgi:hypothetical protein